MSARALKVLVNAVALAASAALARPTHAHAQLRVEIAPTVGAYVSPNALPDPRFFVVCFTKGTGPCGRSATYKQNSSVALGGRITASPWDRGSTQGRVAIDGTLWYMPSRLGPESQGINQAGNIVMASLRLVLRFSPQARISGLLTGGPALIHRFGEFYSGARGTTSPGGTFGVGLDAHLGRHFGLRAEISAYLYGLQLHPQLTPEQQVLEQQGNLFLSPGMTQNDFVFSLSISPFGRRGEGKR